MCVLHLICKVVVCNKLGSQPLAFFTCGVIIPFDVSGHSTAETLLLKDSMVISDTASNFEMECFPRF
jgi:hypothetical protein